MAANERNTERNTNKMKYMISLWAVEETEIQKYMKYLMIGLWLQAVSERNTERNAEKNTGRNTNKRPIY